MSDPRRVEVTLRALRLVDFACRALILLLAGPACAHAQATAPAGETYPTKTIKYVVPYPPGGFNDTLGRIFAQKLQDAWGVPVIVENRPGGGTLIGTEAVAKAAPDGYTLLGVAFPFGANPSIYKSLPYDTVKDFTPLVFAGQTPNLLVVKPSLPVHSVKLIDYAYKKPGTVRLDRYRLVEPSVNGAVQKPRRDRHRACTLQRQCAHGERHAGRAHRRRL